MNKAIRIAFLLLLCLPGALVGAPAHAQSVDGLAAMPTSDLNEWMKNYYRHPEPDRIPAFIDRVAQDKLLSDSWAYPPIAGFLSGLQHAQPELTPVIRAQAEKLLDYERRAVLATVVWGSADGTPARASAMDAMAASAEFVDWGRQSGISDVQNVVLSSPNALDFLWGVFFATGDAGVLEPLPASLPDIHATEAMKQVVALAAMWGLASNGVEHEAVRQFCLDQSRRQPAAIAHILRDIVSKSEGGYSDAVPRFHPLVRKAQ